MVSFELLICTVSEYLHFTKIFQIRKDMKQLYTLNCNFLVKILMLTYIILKLFRPTQAIHNWTLLIYEPLNFPSFILSFCRN